MSESATENGPSRKRIILCLDGTFDDTADTAERVNPGSPVSRFFRWILPPLLFMILWGLRIFPLWKKFERKRFGSPPLKKSFHTNVSFLASAIKSYGSYNGRNCQVPQVVIYIRGIGAVGNPESRFEEAATGNTMTYKVRHAYRLIVDNYRDGDEIFLFGFSRGAFTARAIAGFINWAGLLRKDKATKYFDEVWELSKNRKPWQEGVDGLEFEYTAGIELSGRSTIGSIRHGSNRIRCIGVWDTVGSLGAPPIWTLSKSNDIEVARAARKRYKDFDPELKGNVDCAFQALALDEERFDFYPAVWKKPDGMGDRSFAQVWFPGVHTDVGGGRAGSVSCYAFIWMVSKIQDKNLLDLDTAFIQGISNSLKRPNQISNQAPPWDLEIGKCHWVYPLIGRLGYRNPNMPVACLSLQGCGDTEESEHILSAEQKFHWTVIERMAKLPAYLINCKALVRTNPLRKSDIVTKEEIKAREEDAAGEDQKLQEHWRM